MKICFSVILTLLMFTAPAFATVSVTQPSNGDTTGSPVQFVASSTSSCSKGVASMGVYINNTLKYIGTGSSLNTSIGLSPGTYRAVVQEWDNCGNSTTASRNISVTAKTGVYVTTPANNSNVSASVSYAATASTNTCPQGVSAMGVYADDALKYKVSGAKLSTTVSLTPGTHKTVVQSWDYCGHSSTAPINLNVQGPQGKVISNIQAVPNWDAWGELSPTFSICTSDCPGVKLYMTQHVKSPSKSGNATKFTIGGTTPYSDALWSNKLMGQGTTLNMPDNNRTLIPSVHNFVYDADVYVTNATITQAMEFDVNMYLNGVGMEWGTQCNHLNTGGWDIWDNANAHWIRTGIACPVTNGWHHVSFQVQRKSNNDLLYQTITWDGVTHTVNKTYPPFKVPSGWYGVTVNYQLDGNHSQAQNTTYVDNLNLRYW